jgi:hypothetical protein
MFVECYDRILCLIYFNLLFFDECAVGLLSFGMSECSSVKDTRVWLMVMAYGSECIRYRAKVYIDILYI